MEERIKELLEQIRPNLAAHGGDVEYVSFDDSSGALYLRLKGACYGCPMAQVTLKEGIEVLMHNHLPQVKEVFSVE